VIGQLARCLSSVLTRRQVSGHGTQVKDISGGEQGGLDQCSFVSVHSLCDASDNLNVTGICAVDWRGNGQPPYEDTPGLIIDDVSCLDHWRIVLPIGLYSLGHARNFGEAPSVPVSLDCSF
jgi:hypothetical protein